MGGPYACSLSLILCIITTTVTHGLRVGGGEHNGQVRSCHEREKQALLKFKQSLPSDFSNRLSSWVKEQDCCLWSGVACNNVTGHVTKLDLRNVELDEFPIDTKGLRGEIPDCWMYWPKITVLNLANNNFSEEIPSSMGLMKNMYMLILRNNSFTGDLPFLSNNFTRLSLLDVSVNRLSGSIPKWIGELQWLQVLMLRSNELDGYIPAQLCHLGDLQILDLAHNKLQGTIPHCLRNFSAMTGAGDENLFVGKVAYDSAQSYEPRVMLLWKGREYEFQEILEYVKMIDLSSNQLYGVIPEELTKLLELVALNLSRNNLTGTIPNKVGSLKKLEFLDFSRNRLSGHIPMDMSNLTSLGVLDLSNNNLSGEIPQSTQIQSFNASSFMGNSELCGLPLPKKCEMPHQAQSLAVDDEDDETGIPMWFYISLGLGYSVGISSVFLCLVLNRSWRIVYFRFVEQVTDWVYVVTVVNKWKLQRRMSSCTILHKHTRGDCE